MDILKFDDNNYAEFILSKRHTDDYLFINFVSNDMKMAVSVILYCDVDEDEVFTALRSHVCHKIMKGEYIEDSINIKKLSTLTKMVDPIIAVCGSPSESKNLTAKNLDRIHFGIINKCRKCYDKILPKML